MKDGDDGGVGGRKGKTNLYTFAFPLGGPGGGCNTSSNDVCALPLQPPKITIVGQSHHSRDQAADHAVGYAGHNLRVFSYES